MFKNRKTALVICIIVVALSILTGARRSLREAIRDTEDAFVYGVSGDGNSIYYDLVARTQLAHNLAAVAERYPAVEESLIKKLRDAARALEGENSPARCYRLNSQLEVAFDNLDAALAREDLSAEDEAYRKGIETDFNARAAMISHDGYNDYAREFNEKTLRKFPTNILKQLTFTGSAEIFG